MADVESPERETPAPAHRVERPPTLDHGPFMQRRYVERYLVPLLLPIAVIVGLVAYVLNISRIFLSAHGHMAVVVGAVITVAILLGATLLSASAARLQQSAITLITVGFVASILSSGWLVLGHSQDKAVAVHTLSPTLKATQSLTVTAAPAGNLAFAPNELTAKTGLVRINVVIASPSHTFDFHETNTLFASLSLDKAGTTLSGVAFFGAPGDYHFYCAVPTHEAAGMRGVIHVAGPPMTLTQALVAAKNPAVGAA